jgi:hypothetical protein
VIVSRFVSSHASRARLHVNARARPLRQTRNVTRAPDDRTGQAHSATGPGQAGTPGRHGDERPGTRRHPSGWRRSTSARSSSRRRSSRSAASSPRSTPISASFASTTARNRRTRSPCCSPATPGSSDTNRKHAQPELNVQPCSQAGVSQRPREWTRYRAVWRASCHRNLGGPATERKRTCRIRRPFRCGQEVKV